MCGNGQGCHASKVDATQYLQTFSIQNELGMPATSRRGRNIRIELVAGRPHTLERSCNFQQASSAPNVHGCVPSGLGCCSRRTGSIRSLEPQDVSSVIKRSGNDGSLIRPQDICPTASRLKSENYDRQRVMCSIHKLPRRVISPALRDSYGCVEHSISVQHRISGALPGRLQKRACRSALQSEHAVRVVSSPQTFSTHRQKMGATLNRQVRKHAQLSTFAVQQSVQRSSISRGGCSKPKRLAFTQQLRQPPIQTPTTNHQGIERPGSNCNHYSSNVAGSNLVQTSVCNEYRQTHQTSSVQTHSDCYNATARALEKPKVAVVCVESLWSARLLESGWPLRAAQQIPQAWAVSTRRQYNAIVNRFVSYCANQKFVFPPSHTGPIVSFMCSLCDGSARPESILKGCMAALSWYFTASGLTDLTKGGDIQHLFTALVKSGTQVPRCRSKVMPVQPFMQLFRSWQSSKELPISSLRIKTITLLALSIMLRPSDIAPNGVSFDPESSTTHPLLFSTKDIVSNEDGSLTITFLGIKNDYHREGFQVHLQPGEDNHTDPVSTLLTYIDRTSLLRREVQGDPVFLTLSKPFKALSSQGVAQVLSRAIKLAGLDGRGFTAKSFRPTGATVAVHKRHNRFVIHLNFG